MSILTSQEYGLLDYSFIDFNLDDDDTLKASIRMFQDLNLVDKFRINYEAGILVMASYLYTQVVGFCSGKIMNLLNKN
jgi:hypothetical protein